jgi:hypothetical protein
MQTKIEIDKANLPGMYRRLKGMMSNVSFDSQMLNIAVLRNCKRIQEEAERLIRKREEVFDKYADRYTDEEAKNLENVSAGERKTVSTQNGGERVVFPDEESRDKADEEFKILFDGTTTYTIHQVPLEAMEVPPDTPVGIWEGWEEMFVDMEEEES